MEAFFGCYEPKKPRTPPHMSPVRELFPNPSAEGFGGPKSAAKIYEIPISVTIETAAEKAMHEPSVILSEAKDLFLPSASSDVEVRFFAGAQNDRSPRMAFVNLGAFDGA